MSATLRIDGSAAGAVKAVNDLNKALDGTEKNAEKAVKPSKALVEAAKRIENSVDPQKKYNAQVERLAELVTKAGLSQDVARQKVIEYEKALHKTDDAGDRAFGAAAVSRLMAFTGGLSGIAAAFKHVEDQAQAAADKVLATLGVAGELQQLGPESFARGTANARKLIRLGVTKDPSQALDIATNLENSGFDAKGIDFIIDKVAATRVVKPENLVEVGGALAKFQTAFGEKETGGLESLLNKSLYVSTIPGVQTGLRDTVIESLKFADTFKKFGATDEEALAAFAAVERVSPSAENAAEVLKSFGGQVNARGLGKGGFDATMANVKTLIAKAGGNASKVLGDQNAVAGYDRLVANEAFLREQAGNIGAAGGTLSNSVGLLGQDPVFGAANARALEEGRLAADIERIETQKENLYDAVIAAHGARDVREDTSSIQRGFNWAADNTVDWFGWENSFLQGALDRAKDEPDFLAPETVKQLETYFKQAAEANERTAAAAERTAKATEDAAAEAKKTSDNTDNIHRNQRSRITTRQE